MIVELGAALTYLLCGVLVLRAASVTGGSLAPLGFIVGSCLFAFIGIALGVVGLPVRPEWALGLTWLVALGAWLRFGRGRPAFLRLGLLVLGVAAVVALTRTVHLVSWHSDSFRYLVPSATMARARFDDLEIFGLTTRMASFPFLHVPAYLNGELYLRSFAPLLAVAVAWLLGFLVFEGASSLEPKPELNQAQSAWLGVAAAGLLLTNNRFVFNAFYINAHLLFAASLLAFCGCGWLRLQTDAFPPRGLMVVQCLTAFGMASSRPEGALVGALALLPFFATPLLSNAERAAPALALGTSTLMWHGYTASAILAKSGTVPSSIRGLLALGAVLCGAAALVAWKPSQRRTQPFVRHLPWVSELSLWLLLIGLGFRNPAILKNSVSSMFDNFVLQKAAWGSSFSLLAFLVAGALGLLRIPGSRYLRFSVTTFVPLALVAAYLRGGGYRQGNWDSLARMAIHIVPLASALIAVSALGQWRRWHRSS